MRWRIEIFALLTFAGCATTPLPPPEMSADWKTLQGQAVWKPNAGDGIAGELLLATNSVGDFVIEFAKPPITIARAQRSGARWSFQFPARKKSYAGRGKGPSRVMWLRLAPALAGRDNQWQATTNANGWRVTNNSGESLEGYFAP
jgi:hypothetical protein